MSQALEHTAATSAAADNTYLAAGELGQAANAHERRVAYESLDTVDRAAASRAARAASPLPVTRDGLHADVDKCHCFTWVSILPFTLLHS